MQSVASAPANSRRGRTTFFLSLATALIAGAVFLFAPGTQFLMPGPLSSGHVAIENCSACHANSGDTQLSWINGLSSTDHHADSKACISCHEMTTTAFSPHGVSKSALAQRTEKLKPIAAQTTPTHSAQLQSAAFPIQEMVSEGLNCATCHAEHKGTELDLKEISNERCQACHVVKFDSFDNNHPTFTNYPFKRRTRIIYDHASHFQKHFPETVKKDPTKRPPESCSNCHGSDKDERIMSVTSFDQTCATCHLDQITSKERASGPKGVPFLSVPGIDVATLAEKNVVFGEWPEDSDAELTPFMKVMIRRNDQGRALLQAVDGVDLQDLSSASDLQLKAVSDLVWEIKGIYYSLLLGKASDIFTNLKVDPGEQLTPQLITNLIAGMPRDVLVNLHQQWLPNLGQEMADRQNSGSPEPSAATDETVQPAAASAPAEASAAATPASTESVQPAQASQEAGVASSQETAPSEAETAATPAPAATPEPAQEQADTSEASNVASEQSSGDQPSGEQSSGTQPIEERPLPPAGKPDDQDCVFSIFGQCLVRKDANAQPGNTIDNLAAVDTNAPGAAQSRSFTAPRQAAGFGAGNVRQQLEQPNAIIQVADDQPSSAGANKGDALLNPSEEELRALGTRAGEIGNPGQLVPGVKIPTPSASAPASATPAATPTAEPSAEPSAEKVVATPEPEAAPAPTIGDDVEAQNWAEYGGWYQQDYAVFYRPTGHKDKFIYTWLTLAGSQPKDDTAVVFDALTSKGAQGSCVKCHSIDASPDAKRLINFSPQSVSAKQGAFTKFKHQPHFSLMDDRGCLSCHKLQKDKSYLKGFEQEDPNTFTSNFDPVEKQLCQSCHADDKARQDCLLCHQYHVDGIAKSSINTKIPKN